VRRLPILISLLIACGGGRKIVETEESGQEPAWAADYTAGVQEACECTDAACIRGRRPALDAMVAQHGGLDDAPASVHQGKAKLEVCWKEIARDLALELGDLEKTICECKSSVCADEYSQRLDVLTAKYSAADPNALRDVPEATPESKAVLDRIARCLSDKTISAADYLAKTEAIGDELCACQDGECTKAAVRKRFAIFDAFLFIDEDADLAVRTHAAESRVCKCMADALKRGVQIDVSSAKLDLSVNMKCD